MKYLKCLKSLKYCLFILKTSKKYLNLNQDELDPTIMYHVFQKIQLAYQSAQKYLGNKHKLSAFGTVNNVNQNHIIISHLIGAKYNNRMALCDLYLDCPKFVYQDNKSTIKKLKHGGYKHFKQIIKLSQKKSKHYAKLSNIFDHIGLLSFLGVVLSLIFSVYISHVLAICVVICAISCVLVALFSNKVNKYSLSSKIKTNLSIAKFNDFMNFINHNINVINAQINKASKVVAKEKYKLNYSKITNRHQKLINNSKNSWNSLVSKSIKQAKFTKLGDRIK